MKITDFYSELEKFILLDGSIPFKRLFDLHEGCNPSCSLSDVNDLFNDKGTDINFRVRRRILDGAYRDLRNNEEILQNLHKILMPGYPYRNSAKKENPIFREIKVIDALVHYLKKIKSFYTRRNF